MSKYPWLIVLAIVSVSLITGCNSKSLVVLPDDTLSPQDSSIGSSADAGNYPSHLPVGFYTIEIDTVRQEIKVVPVRTSDLHVNVTNTLNGTNGVTAAFVPGESQPSTGLFVLDISIEHPFSIPNLTGFDVRGIFITPGTLNIGPLVFADPSNGEARLLNADGYTQWWNPTEFTAPGMFGYTKGNLTSTPGSMLTATVNPYKYFADILTATDSMAPVTSASLTSDGGRGVFTAGSTNTRRYEIQFPMNPAPVVKFGYAVDASWAAPLPNPPTQVPDDFPIAANMPEAYRIAAAVKLNTLFYDSESGVAGGLLRLQANVYDWQGQYFGNVENQIGQVRAFTPDLISGGADGTFFIEANDAAKYKIDMPDALPTQAGKALVTVKVLPEGGPNYDQGFGPAPAGPVAAWQCLTVDIPDPDCVTDPCNDFIEAYDFDLTNYNTDTLCASADYRDFWKMVIPSGHTITGDLILWADVEPTKFAIYDSEQALIQEVDVTSGLATINLDSLNILPGIYYLRVLTQSSGTAFIYAIEPSVTVTDVTPSDPVLVDPHDIYFNPKHARVHDNYTIFYDNTRIWVCDMTNPTVPVTVSHIDEGFFVYNVAVSWPYLYFGHAIDVGAPLSLDMVDLSDPANPILHHDLFGGGTTEYYDAVAWGDYLFVSASLDAVNRLQVYDISTTPANPVLIKNHSVSSSWTNLQIMDTGTEKAIFGKTDTGRIGYFSLQDLTAWDVPGDVSDMPKRYNDFTVYGNKMTVLMDDYAGNYSFFTYTFTGTDLSPTFYAGLSLPYDDNCIAASGDYLYTGGYDKTMSIIDNQDINAPSLVQSYSISYYPEDFVVFNSDYLLFLNGANGVTFWGTDGVGGISYAGEKAGLSTIYASVMVGDAVYVGEPGNLFSIDVSDPAAPVIADRMWLPTAPLKMAGKNDKLVFVDYLNNAVSIDITDPYNMLYAQTMALPESIDSMTMTDSCLYVADSTNTLKTYSLASWPDLTYADSDALANTSTKMVSDGNALYVRIGANIEVFAIPSPATTSHVFTYTPLTYPTDMKIGGNLLYIGCNSNLEIADITNPFLPTYLASENYPDAPFGSLLAVGNQFAYMYSTVGADTSPTAFSIYPPENPTVYGQLYDTDYVITMYNSFVKDEYLIELGDPIAFREWKLY